MTVQPPGSWTFTPTEGRLTGIPYVLPPPSDDTRTQGRTSTMQTLANNDGGFDSSGTAPMPLIPFAFTTTHNLTPAFYKPSGNGMGRDYYNGTNSDFTARENALLHLDVALPAGGEGTLVYTLWPGVQDPVDGSTVSFLSAQAKIGGDIQVARTQSKATVTINWVVPSAYWTGSNGRLYMGI